MCPLPKMAGSWWTPWCSKVQVFRVPIHTFLLQIGWPVELHPLFAEVAGHNGRESEALRIHWSHWCSERKLLEEIYRNMVCLTAGFSLGFCPHISGRPANCPFNELWERSFQGYCSWSVVHTPWKPRPAMDSVDIHGLKAIQLWHPQQLLVRRVVAASGLFSSAAGPQASISTSWAKTTSWCAYVLLNFSARLCWNVHLLIASHVLPLSEDSNVIDKSPCGKDPRSTPWHHQILMESGHNPHGFLRVA